MSGKLFSGTLSKSRHAAGRVRRLLFPAKAEAAWRKLAAEASRVPRYTPGVCELMGYRLHYVDLLTVAPQWKDTFVDEVHAFDTGVPSPRILDCGANVGVVTLYLKRRHPTSNITAFEADPSIASALARNIKDNGLRQVKLISAAVWDASGETSFVAEGSDAGGIASEYRGDSERIITVPTLRLRDFIAAEDQVDLLKLDIEGAEHRVLADCEPELHRVKAIAVELHDFDARKRRNPATLELLSRAGFVYAHGGVVPVPSQNARVRPSGPFPSQATRWVERVYAWRE